MSVSVSMSVSVYVLANHVISGILRRIRHSGGIYSDLLMLSKILFMGNLINRGKQYNSGTLYV